MTKGQFYDEVKRRADTPEQKIPASEVNQVLKAAFSFLKTMDGPSMMQTLHACMKEEPEPYKAVKQEQ